MSKFYHEQNTVILKLINNYFSHTIQCHYAPYLPSTYTRKPRENKIMHLLFACYNTSAIPILVSVILCHPNFLRCVVAMCEPFLFYFESDRYSKLVIHITALPLLGDCIVLLNARRLCQGQCRNLEGFINLF